MGKYNIQRYTKSVTVADGQTVGTINTDSLNGLIRGIIANVPQLTGTTTITLAITDQDGATVYSKASIAENAKTGAYIDANNYPLQIPVSGVLTFTVTQTNAQSGAASVVPVTLLIDRGN
jgi:hypothetical protein